MPNLHSLLCSAAVMGMVWIPQTPTLGQWSTATDPHSVEHARAVEAYEKYVASE